jgi:hypothetical protein
LLRKASNAARNNRNNRVQDPAVHGPAPDHIVESDPPAPPTYPVIPISSCPTPIPITKRARDEELEILAVVLKLRKEVEAIQGPLPDDKDNGDEGEMPQIVKDLALRYPQTKILILFQILENKLDPFDLYKLHTEFGSVSSDAINDEFFAAKGNILYQMIYSPRHLLSLPVLALIPIPLHRCTRRPWYYKTKLLL